MAKDKDQEIFVEPEFIEKDFLQSEKERAKSTIVMFLLAAALGLFSGYLFLIGIWYVGLLLMFLFIISFKRLIQALHLKMPKRGSQVFILVMVFILTWIIFWTISLNPPISSVGGPQVSSIQVYNPQTSSWSAMAQSNGVYHYSITQNGVLSLRVYISYITPISNVTITVSNSASPLTINYFHNYAYFNESVQPALYVFNVEIFIHDTEYTSTLQLQILSA
jgi:predicted PurR-regulated permease PerM